MAAKKCTGNIYVIVKIKPCISKPYSVTVHHATFHKNRTTNSYFIAQYSLNYDIPVLELYTIFRPFTQNYKFHYIYL